MGASQPAGLCPECTRGRGRPLGRSRPRIDAVDRLTRVRQYRNLDKMEGILRDYFARYSFGSVASYLGLDPAAPPTTIRAVEPPPKPRAKAPRYVEPPPKPRAEAPRYDRSHSFNGGSSAVQSCTAD